MEPRPVAIASRKNEGSGRFSSPNHFSHPNSDKAPGWSVANSLEVDDFDGDGDPDMVVGSINHGASLFNNDGEGNFQFDSILIESATKLEKGDINGDGLVDLVATQFFGIGIWFLPNRGEEGFDHPIQVVEDLDHARDIKIVDFDGDGDNDLLVTSGFASLSQFLWFENVDQQGTFQKSDHSVSSAASINVDVTLFYGQFDVADFDGDGDLDAVVPFSDKITFVENTDGKGILDSRTISSTKGILATKSVDLDQDGDFDIVANDTLMGEIVWLENLDANAVFADAVVISDPAAVEQNTTMAIVDLNSDGHIDLLTSSVNNSRIALYTNDGQQEFSRTQLTGPNTSKLQSVHPIDFDNDGDQDFVGIELARIVWYENRGFGTLWSQHQIHVWPAARIFDFFWSDIQIGDIDQDNDVDIIASINNDVEQSYRFVILRNEDGRFVETQFDISHGVGSFQLADLDADEDLDLLVEEAFSGFVWYENNQMTFARHTIAEMRFFNSNDMSAGDVDNDGDLDVLLTTNQNNVVLYEHQNNTENVFKESTVITSYPDGKNVDVRFADFDGDGDQDVFSAGQSFENLNGPTTMSWFENVSGTGIISSRPQPIGIFNSYAPPILSDVDQDGDVDIVNFDSDDRQIKWWENDGRGVFDSIHIISDGIASGIAPRLGLADFDGNGKPDIVAGISGNSTDRIVAFLQDSVELDFNDDLNVDVNDVQQLCNAIRDESNDDSYDLNHDQQVNVEDMVLLMNLGFDSVIGDANLDGKFSSADFVQVFQEGKFARDEPASWSQGDWDCNGRFESADLVLVFQHDGFTEAAHPDASRPFDREGDGQLGAVVEEPTRWPQNLSSGVDASIFDVIDHRSFENAKRRI